MKCTRCKWHSNDSMNCVGVIGNTDAEVLFVVESFNRTNIKNQTAYTGETEAIFEHLLEESGSDYKDIAIMPAMRCYKNDPPTTSELDACFIFTHRDIQAIKPKLVIAMGESAFYQVSGKGKDDYKHYRDQLFYSEKVKCNVFCLYNPAIVLHQPSKLKNLKNLFKLIPTAIGKKLKDVRVYDYVYIHNQEQFDLHSSRLLNADQLYFDIEATGLDEYVDELTLIQINVGEEPVLLFDPKVFKDNKDFFVQLFMNKPVSGQDFQFDVRYIYEKFGIFPAIWEHDTCLAEYIISGMYGNDLTTLTWKYCPESGGYDDYVKLMGGAHKVRDRDKLNEYGSTDVGVLPKIIEKQVQILKRMDKYELFKKFVMPTNKILTKMSICGIEIDLKALHNLDSELEIKAEKTLYKALLLPGVDETEKHFNKKFNPRSSDHIKYLLLDYYGLPVIQTTKKGNPCIGKEEMKKYAEQYDNQYCKVMEKYRSLQTIRDNFLSGVLYKLVDGVAHTKYSIHATTTGRPNSKNPNMLNPPRLFGIRKIYKARDGHMFVVADEAQLEVRIASVIYNEPRLIEICNDPSKDMHSEITGRIFNMDPVYIKSEYDNGNKEIKELRNKGKAIQFGILYQKGPTSLSYELEITEEEAQQFIDGYYQGFPDMYKNIEHIKKLIKKQWFLDNYFNFRRRWEEPDKDDSKYKSIVSKIQREAVNFMIQSPAWNIIELCMINIDDYIIKNKMESRIALQVYDSIAVEAPKDEVNEVAKLMDKVMTTVIEPYEGLNRVKLFTDVEVGVNMLDLERYEIKA